MSLIGFGRRFGGYAGDVSAEMREALDKPDLDRNPTDIYTSHQATMACIRSASSM
jgi:hypothetical protein